MPQSVKLEIKIFETIKQLCSTALDKYPNPIEEDYELLKNESLTFN